MSDNSHAAMCIYCGETVIYDTRQVTDMAAAHEQLMAHDQKCAKNPIVAERDVWQRMSEQYKREAYALAAQVDGMERQGDQMAIELREWLRSYGPYDETDRMLEVWEEAKSRIPATSLARLKAQWQAEALEELMPSICDVADRAEVRSMYAELRRQAEEPTE